MAKHHKSEENEESHKEKKARRIKPKVLKYVSLALLIIVIGIAVFLIIKNTGQKNLSGLIIINDKRCDTCAIAQIETQLKSMFPSMKVTTLDYSDKEGRALYDSLKITALPAILFDKSVEKEASYTQIQNYLDAKGDYMSLRIGSSFDPTKEICDNKIDDNGDGKIDCLDPECTASFECREEKKANLMLFVMSDCPYGKKAIEALKEVYTTFNKSFAYEVHYIASESSTGFTSLHGQYEVDEDIVQLCAKKYSPDKWLNYTYCRSVNGIKGIDWKTCGAEAKVDVTKVDSCAKGEEGKTLLREDIKIANAMNIGASPTWIANNRYQFGGIDAATVQTQFCKYNPELSGCSAIVSAGSSVPAGSCG
ncbi:MAG: hypothetical protein NTV63_05135 [Candidatus Woesearchaeota archaeon]|nr:hypothetical protein [Candidatus Woesearchaeota archaeon]